MIPGFVSIYKDKDKFVHLYFYPGINNDNTPIYKNIDLSNCKIKYEEVANIDNSIDYKFLNKDVIKINCKLLDNKTKKYSYEHLELL